MINIMKKEYNSFNNNRNKELDILKGIAIILVILGHTIQYTKGEEYLNKGYFYYNYLFTFIYSFHMPLFMMISGWLFYFSIKKYNIKNLIINKFQTIIIPVITWTLLVDLIFMILNKDIPSVIGIILDILNGFWFFWAVFYCSLGLIIGNKVFKDNFLFHIIVIIILIILPNIFNKDLFGYMYPYFVTGYYLNKQKEKIKISKIIYLPILLLYFIMLVCWDRKFYIYTSWLNIYKNEDIFNQIYIDIYRWIIGFLGCILIYGVVKSLYNKFKKAKIFYVLSFTGCFTMGIYIFNIYISTYLLIKCSLFNAFNEFVYTVVCILISIVITFISLIIVILMKQIKVLKKFLFGYQ